MTLQKTTGIAEQPFSKSVSAAEKYKRLLDVAALEDTMAILINADPDAIAGAIALKRIFWRRVKKVQIYHINTIKRADNLALIKLLKIDQRHIRELQSSRFTRWAIVDSQPHHDELFEKHPYDIIIDHHPRGPKCTGRFVDIQEDYGATSTILTEYLRAARIKISPRLATALFYGIKNDTENFIRPTLPNDMDAFRYLYPLANMNIVKKIEFSEMTKKTLSHFRMAMENLIIYKNTAFIHMGRVNNPDILVMIADFFLKLAEAHWCIVSGLYGQKLIVIFRNAGFRRDAGKMAQKLFGQWGAAGGHKSAARAEILLKEIEQDMEDDSKYKKFVMSRIKGL